MDRWQDFRRPPDLGDWHRIERRIGVRVPNEGLQVRWLPPGGSPAAGADGWIGRVVQVSVTGAAVELAGDLSVDVPSEARLRYEGGETVVVVRHASPAAIDGVMTYGVEFVSFDDALRDRVYALVADARADRRSS